MPFRKKKDEKTPADAADKKPKTSLLRKLRGKKKDNAGNETPNVVPPENQVLIPTRDPAVKPQHPTASNPPPPPAASITTLPIRSQPSRAKSLTKSLVRRCYCRHGRKSIFSGARSSAPSPPPPNAPSCIQCGRCRVCASSSLSGTYPRCQLCKTKSPLQALPPELLDCILVFLPPLSTWLLRLTSRFFYTAVPAPIGPLDFGEYHALYISLRSFVPKELSVCWKCMRYHPWTPDDYYTYQGLKYCMRDLSRTRRDPKLPSHVLLGLTHYICMHCRTVRGNRSCLSCGKCEFCADVKFQGTSIECIECDAGKARCFECKALRLPHRGCKGCGRCEGCASTLFQFGVEYCVSCGGGWNVVDKGTKKVLVESGPGYEMYHYRDGNSGVGGGREGRIGIR